MIFPVNNEYETHIGPIEISIAQEYHETIQSSMDQIDSFIQDINALYGKWTNIHNRMMLCNKYVQDIMIYEQLADELIAWLECFEDISYFEELNHLLNKLCEKINNEITEILNLKQEMGRCQNNYKSVYS